MRITRRQTAPQPVKIDSRIAFAIAYFSTEADATEYAKVVTARGDAYNGGYCHGMACGRDAGHDYTDPNLGKLYAVTTR